jgi:mono/diheme cytochrome c family protein
MESLVKPTRMFISAVALATAAAGFSAEAADVAAGKKTFTAICSACHKLEDYQAKSEAQLQTTLKGIVAGTVKHEKKLKLSQADIDNVVAYIKAPAAK